VLGCISDGSGLVQLVALELQTNVALSIMRKPRIELGCIHKPEAITDVDNFVTGETRRGLAKVPRSPPASSIAVSEVMRANRPQQTGPELALRRALTSAGIRGYRTNLAGIPGRPDIAFTRKRLAVFVNGCYWHQHECARSPRRIPRTNAEYWKLKFALNRQRDELKVKDLRALGWRVLTIWECELREDPAACSRKVITRLANAVHPPPSSKSPNGSRTSRGQWT
jgi:DNA mismatch endonuclease, patch repair protein